jgi:hypothetical protein
MSQQVLRDDARLLLRNGICLAPQGAPTAFASPDSARMGTFPVAGESKTP